MECLGKCTTRNTVFIRVTEANIPCPSFSSRPQEGTILLRRKATSPAVFRNVKRLWRVCCLMASSCRQNQQSSFQEIICLGQAEKIIRHSYKQCYRDKASNAVTPASWLVCTQIDIVPEGWGSGRKRVVWGLDWLVLNFLLLLFEVPLNLA